MTSSPARKKIFIFFPVSAPVFFVDKPNNGELKQQRWRRLQKRQFKSEFAPLQTLSHLFHLVYFVKCWQMFLELNSERAVSKFRKRKESCCLVFPSSTKREFRHFHVVVVQRRQRNVQKSVMHVQSCCFANQTYCFLPFSLPSASSLLKLPNQPRPQGAFPWLWGRGKAPWGRGCSLM